MARVSITINGNTYDISCADGEEQNILDLAASFDGRVAQLVAAIGQAGEARLLAMAGLLLSDELGELKEEVQRLRAEAEITPAAPAINSDAAESRAADLLEVLAERIETIALRVEQA